MRRKTHPTAREAPLGAKRARGDVPKCESTKGAEGVGLSFQKGKVSRHAGGV